MNPFYFGDTSKPLFGVHHPPARGVRRREQVLLCYPCGHEYMRTHRAFVQLALRIASGGCPVLRFDYSSAGDSAGETGEGTMAAWQEDVLAAARELADTVGAGRFMCIALRLGAALLPGALSAGLDAAKLVLWDPVVSGDDYLRELRFLHGERCRLFSQVTGGGALEEAGGAGQELAGYRYATELLMEIEAVDLTRAAWGRARKVFLLLSEETPANQALRGALTEQGLLAGYELLPSAGDWGRVDGRARISAEALDTIAGWVTEGGR
jgi:uncharacterized protein